MVLLVETVSYIQYILYNENKFENVLTLWSVAQAGSNDKKNWGSKI